MNFNHTALVEQLNNLVVNQLLYYRKLVLAYSGGLDSTVLLDVLTSIRDKSLSNNNNKIDLNFRAIHIHHGLNHNADYWANHCLEECQQRNIILNVIHIKIDKFTHGIEGSARNARYFILKKNLIENEVLLTAHHQNDQAETLLLALKRGSGPKGLSSMAPDSILYNHHHILRPLLNCSQSILRSYAIQRQLNWIEDYSNTDIQYDRNFLRTCILPSLCKRWPYFIQSVSRSAQLCAEQEFLLDKLLSVKLHSLTYPDGSLNLIELTKLSEIEYAAILRRWLVIYGILMPSLRKLKCIWYEIICSKHDSIAQLKLGNKQIRRFKDRLYIIPLYPEIPDKDRKIKWESNINYLNLPIGLGILYKQMLTNMFSTKKKYQKSKIVVLDNNHNDINYVNCLKNNHISSCNTYYNLYASSYKNNFINKKIISIVRAPLSHEMVSIQFGSVKGLLYINNHCHGKKLKKIWQELHVPPWQRKIIPLLFYNDILIAALGKFITREGDLQVNQLQWKITWFYFYNK